MITALLAAAAFLAGATPAAPATPSAAPTQTTVSSVVVPPQKKPTDQAANTLICRNEPVMGSRLKVKRCNTQAEIDDRRLQDRADLEKLQGTGMLPR